MTLQIQKESGPSTRGVNGEPPLPAKTVPLSSDVIILSSDDGVKGQFQGGDPFIQAMQSREKALTQSETQEEKSSSQLDASDGIIAEVRDSMKEGKVHGEEKEDRPRFISRLSDKGFTVRYSEAEGDGRAAAYGYRDVYPQGCTGEVRRGLNEFGIPSFVMDGTLWQNQDGLSRLLTVSDAAAVPGVGVFVNAETTIPPMRIVGHEAFKEIVEGGIN